MKTATQLYLAFFLTLAGIVTVIGTAITGASGYHDQNQGTRFAIWNLNVSATENQIQDYHPDQKLNEAEVYVDGSYSRPKLWISHGNHSQFLETDICYQTTRDKYMIQKYYLDGKVVLKAKSCQ